MAYKRCGGPVQFGRQDDYERPAAHFFWKETTWLFVRVSIRIQ